MSPRFSISTLSVQSDARLAELAGRGQERAFDALVRRYRRPLMGYCGRLGLSEQRAEDVLQQALTRAWLALGKGIEVREPRAWLYRIVHNAAINAIRGSREHCEQSIEAIPAGSQPSSPGDIEDGLRAREALGHVAALPEMQRDVVVLTAIEGRSHEEAAFALGLSDGAVRGLLYRARTTLRSAAAALSPQGLIACLTRAKGGSSLAERSLEITTGGAAIGAAGTLSKGVAVTAVAGLLAAGGTVAGIQSAGGRRHHGTAARSAGLARAQSSSSALGAPATATSPALLASGTGQSSSSVSGGGPGSATERRGGRHRGREGGSRHRDGTLPTGGDAGGGSGAATEPRQGEHRGDRHGGATLTSGAAPEEGGRGSDRGSGSAPVVGQPKEVVVQSAGDGTPGTSGDAASKGDGSSGKSPDGSRESPDRHGGSAKAEPPPVTVASEG